MGIKVWPPLIVQVIAKQEFALDLQVSHDNDDCRLIAGVYQACPGVCPPLLEAGRWQAPAEMVGSGIRFRNVTIPKAATIVEATLTFTASVTRAATPVNTRIGAEQADNPADFSGEDFASAYARLNNHGTQVDWDGLGPWTQDVEYTSGDIKTVIQEIVDRAGWSSGNALVLSWDDFDHRTSWVAGRTQRPYSYNQSNTKAAKLSISYRA